MQPQNPFQHPEPAAPVSGHDRSFLPTPVLWTLCLLVFAGIVFVNQFFGESGAKPAETPPIAAPGIDNQLLMSTKLAVKLSPFTGGGATMAGSVRQAAAASKAPEDILRTAIALGELESAEAGLKKLDEYGAVQFTEREAVLKDDIEVVTSLLTDGAPRPDAAKIDALKERHGYFADLALVRGLKDPDPARANVESGGGQIMLVGFGAMCAAALAFFGAIASIIVLITRAASGTLVARTDRPGVPGSIYIEAFLVFLTSFMALHVGFPLVMSALGVVKPGETVPGWVLTSRLLLQWSLMATIFWPVLRGVPWEEWKRHVGWRCEKGVRREIGEGLIGYGGTLPALLLAAIVVAVSMLMRKGAAPPENPIAEMLTETTGFDLLLLFGMMTIWAPIVEESFFRGMLFGRLRGSMGVVGAALLSGLWFGLMHGYSGILLLPVITIGVCFAFVREWRGSLVPTVVAHAVHNFAIGALAIGFFTALR